MDNTRLTIACEENREGGYEIEVTFERNSRTKFREAFLSVDKPIPPYFIEERNQRRECWKIGSYKHSISYQECHR